MSQKLTTPRILQRCPLFGGLTPVDLDRVAGIARVNEYRRGEMIFSEADRADRFFVVLDGDVKLYKLAPSGKEQILHVARPFQSFAEAVVFMGGAYPASCAALHDAKLVEIPRAPFLDMVRGDPDFSIRVMASMARWLRELVSLVEDLSFAEVPARLARRIRQAASDQGVELRAGAVVTLPMSKTDLARLLGTVSETLSRVFARLADDGVLRVQGRAVTILDAELLAALENR